MSPVSAEVASTVPYKTGPTTSQLWTGEELTGLYPSLLSYSGGGAFIVLCGIPAGERTSLHWVAPNPRSHAQPSLNSRGHKTKQEGEKDL